MAKIDLDMSPQFLQLLDPKSIFTFQTFDDSPARRRSLAMICHGTFEEHADTLAGANQQGAGVFVTVNETDGRGRKAENIIRVRAAFVDLDGAALEPVMAFRIPPSIVVESSPERWHAYWLCDDIPLDQFKTAQQRLAKHFDGDSSVCDLPRVMRLPGFLHQKSAPFLTKIHNSR